MTRPVTVSAGSVTVWASSAASTASVVLLASRGDRRLIVARIRVRPASLSAVGVGNLANRSRMPGWWRRDPTARSNAGEIATRLSRQRFVIRVWSAARSMS